MRLQGLSALTSSRGNSSRSWQPSPLAGPFSASRRISASTSTWVTPEGFTSAASGLCPATWKPKVNNWSKKCHLLGSLFEVNMLFFSLKGKSCKNLHKVRASVKSSYIYVSGYFGDLDLSAVSGLSAVSASGCFWSPCYTAFQLHQVAFTLLGVVYSLCC